MIAKKSSKADLERKRFAFFQIGLVISGAAVLVAFEYSSAHLKEKERLVVDSGPTTWTAPLYDPDELIPEKPEPQTRSNIQTMPIDELTITHKEVKTGQVVEFINVDPCIGCDDNGDETWVIQEDNIGKRKIWEFVDVDPKFPGGEVAMNQFIQENLKVPQIVQEMGKGGMVYIHFVVDETGQISNVKGEGDVNSELLEEAIRVVNLMPDWIPGEQAGKKVAVRFTIPISVHVK